MELLYCCNILEIHLMKLLNKKTDLSYLKSQIQEGDFDLFISDDPLSYMSCFVCRFKNKITIEKNWETIQNLISGYYQPSFELARWNVYIIFICIEELTQWDKYLIENDTYTARKVVIDNLKTLPNIEEVEEILDNYLLGADLELNKKAKHYSFKINPNAQFLIDSIPLESSNVAKKKRADLIKKLVNQLSNK